MPRSFVTAATLYGPGLRRTLSNRYHRCDNPSAVYASCQAARPPPMPCTLAPLLRTRAHARPRPPQQARWHGICISSRVPRRSLTGRRGTGNARLTLAAEAPRWGSPPGPPPATLTGGQHGTTRAGQSYIITVTREGSGHAARHPTLDHGCPHRSLPPRTARWLARHVWWCPATVPPV